MLQEIEKIRQQSTHEGVHKDGDEYRAKIETATKEYMPLSVSTVYSGMTINLFWGQWDWSFTHVLLPFIPQLKPK